MSSFSRGSYVVGDRGSYFVNKKPYVVFFIPRRGLDGECGFTATLFKAFTTDGFEFVPEVLEEWEL
jgi:hypothetical protein